MGKLKTAAWIMALGFSLFLYFYRGDNSYLRSKSADRTWQNILAVLNNIVEKGDKVEYVEDTQETDETKLSYQNRFAQQV